MWPALRACPNSVTFRAIGSTGHAVNVTQAASGNSRGAVAAGAPCGA